MKQKCKHCAFEGRMFYPVDSQDRRCQLRITNGGGKEKERQNMDFFVCPQCMKINLEEI